MGRNIDFGMLIRSIERGASRDSTQSSFIIQHSQIIIHHPLSPSPQPPKQPSHPQTQIIPNSKPDQSGSHS